VDLPSVAEVGRPLTGEERRVLGEVRKRLDEASTVAAEDAAPKRERERVIEELTKHSAGNWSPTAEGPSWAWNLHLRRRPFSVRNVSVGLIQGRAGRRVEVRDESELRALGWPECSGEPILLCLREKLLASRVRPHIQQADAAKTRVRSRNPEFPDIFELTLDELRWAALHEMRHEKCGGETRQEDVLGR
jgi:hypothetical protein